MALRPRLTGPQRVSRASGRMAPGGRMRSESPIPRSAQRRVRGMGVAPTEPPVVPGFLWPMDDASAPFTEATGGPPLAPYDPGSIAYGYQVPGIAPGSTHAALFPPLGSVHLESYLAPSAAGWLTFDLWFAGVSTSLLDFGFSAGGSIGFYDAHLGTYFGLTVNWDPNPFFLISLVDPVNGYTTATRPITSGTVHLQFGIQVGVQAVVRWNGATVLSASGVPWDTEDFEIGAEQIGMRDASTTLDQLHVYAGPPEGM